MEQQWRLLLNSMPVIAKLVLVVIEQLVMAVTEQLVMAVISCYPIYKIPNFEGLGHG